MEKVMCELIKELGDHKVLYGDAIADRYVHIWKMDERLHAKAVLLPQTTQDVATIAKICHSHNQPIVVHGGLTNLVGSTETNIKEVVISMEKMNRIEEVDPMSRTCTVQAGVVLEAVQESADSHHLLFPLNFGAKGSSQVGGFISTNAGGLRVFRFGMTRNLVLGLEAVLADGTIISSIKKIIKDNSGYDIKQLFIGSEGTLGIITKATLKLVEKPKSRVCAFAAIDSYESVVSFLKFMDQQFAGMLSGYELIWNSTYQAMTSEASGVKPPLGPDYPYYVLVEGLGSDQLADQAKMMTCLEVAMENGLIVDAVPAQSSSDVEWFFRIREDVHVLKSQCTIDQHFDISLPIPLIGDFFANAEKALYNLSGVQKVFLFGHIADGNIHIIVGKENDHPSLTKQINDIVYLPLQGIGGSISAEHGIGLHKKSYLYLSRTQAEIKLMECLKQSMDPKQLLNRGKVLH